MKMTLGGSILPTSLRAAFMCTGPKSAKRQSSHLILFTLLGSVCAKAARKTIVKLTPDIFFNLTYKNVL